MSIDAFILYNEREEGVPTIVEALEARGVTTFFWRRDIPPGEKWDQTEGQALRDARVVLVFLGAQSWGPNHLRLTVEAQSRGKTIIPLLIGDPPESALLEAQGLFHYRRYLDLRNGNLDALPSLVGTIQWSPSGSASQFYSIVGVLIDGNEEERAWTLQQIRMSRSLDRVALSERLALEIRTRFAPESETRFAEAIRDPKRISSIRSWMLSCLIWADARHAHRELVLQHLDEHFESDRNVRFWALAGLYQVKAPYLLAAVEISFSDSAPEVSLLAKAVNATAEEIVGFKERLASEDFEAVWPVLRLLRVMPLVELTEDVCRIFVRSTAGSPFSYDALYALLSPPMAREAAQMLSQSLGTRGLVNRVIAECRGSNTNAVRNFSWLLVALDSAEVDAALKEARSDAGTAEIALKLESFVVERRTSGEATELFVADYASDTIDVRDDPLDIEEDVQTLTAVMMSKKVKPPLAVGLFGDWGTGKSYFMKSMRAAAEALAVRTRAAQDSTFCADVVQIEFNAWHYVDTHLLASLVSYILAQLAAYVSPRPGFAEQQTTLLTQLAGARAELSAAEAAKEILHKQIENRWAELLTLQSQREAKEVGFTDLRLADLQTLLSKDPQLKENMDKALAEIGIPGVVASVADLANAVSEANSLRGRATAWALSILNGKNRFVLIGLLIFVVVGIPALALLIQKVTASQFVAWMSALGAELVALIGGTAMTVRNAAKRIHGHLATLEQARKKVEKILEEKRNQPTQKEASLHQEIDLLKTREQEAATRLSAAAANALKLEENIREIEESRSLARFLLERTQSEDYRKHLGLISTIRHDFESLGDRLAAAASSQAAGPRPVDRIILYIDDLDRCPADKVLEVLQAVHLLLAYPLFVVIVGVDPRWLLHSLRATYPAFKNEGGRPGAKIDPWITTPQNYLEKIFQIPFTLRPMTEAGYGRLIDRLLAPAEEAGGQAVGQAGAQEGNGATNPSERGPRGSRSDATRTPSDVASGPESEPAPATESLGLGDVTRHSDKPPKFVVQRDALLIRRWEADFADRLFALIPTPRAAKRFSNIYRMLKAPVGRERLPSFEGTAEMPGEFQMPMLLLAISIGASAEAAFLFPELKRLAAESMGLAEALKRLTADKSSPPGLPALAEKIRPLTTDNRFPDSAETLAEWIPRVARFSFDLGRGGTR